MKRNCETRVSEMDQMSMCHMHRHLASELDSILRWRTRSPTDARTTNAQHSADSFPSTATYAGDGLLLLF
jgi:hypothetical protein